MDPNEDNELALLLADIGKQLITKDIEPLKHFAYDYMKYSDVEACTEQPNPVFLLLLKMFRVVGRKRMIDWLRDVFYRLNNITVLKLIVKFEIERNKTTDPFTVMLNDLAYMITKSQFEDFKRYYTAIVKDSELEQIDNVYELFRVLKLCGLLEKQQLGDFKERLKKLDNTKLLRIVEDYEKNPNSSWTDPRSTVTQTIISHNAGQDNRPKNRVPVSQMISSRLPLNVTQIEQQYNRGTVPPGIRPGQLLPSGSHQLSVENKMPTGLAYQCTDPAEVSAQTGQSLSSYVDIHQPQLIGHMGGARARQELGLSPMGDEPYPERKPISKQVATIFPHVQPAWINEEHLDQTQPKTCQDQSPMSEFSSHNSAAPELNLLNVDESVKTDSMEPKQLEMGDLTEVKQVDVVVDDVTRQKMSNREMLQLARALTAAQQREMASGRRVEESQSQLSSKWGATGNRDEMQQDGEASEVTSAAAKQYLNQLHTDSPSLSMRSNMRGEAVSPRNGQKTGNLELNDMQRSDDGDIGYLSKARMEEQGDENSSKKAQQPKRLYNYQKELAAPAIAGYNCIMCAPTGSGKTLTAAYICHEKRRQALVRKRPFKALFIVCIRNLIEQQKDELRKIFIDEEDSSHVVGGINETITLSEMLEHHDIVVLTAQILVNALKNKDIYLEEIQLMVLDECHHTNLGHPYNVIMLEYHRLKLENRMVPQVVGLTASLGVGNTDDPINHYIVICANLDCSCITHVRQNVEELLEHNPRPKKNQIISVLPRDCNDLFILMITYLMKETEDMTPHLDMVKPQRGSQKYESWMVAMRTEAEKTHIEDGIFTCQTLLIYNQALMFCDELQIADVIPLLVQYFVEDMRAPQPTPIRRRIYDKYESHLSELEAVADKETLADNEKVRKLHDLLLDLYQTNPASKGILLTRTRFGTEGLVSFIKRQSRLQGLVKCAKLVGQGRGDGTMTDINQQRILSLFKADYSEKDNINLLVATDVAQEGLDMPQCNFVIRYNFVSNEIGSVQSRGRARAKNSECYLIVNRGSVNEIREYENLAKEHAMMEALDEIDLLDEDNLLQKITEQQEILWKKKEDKEQHRSVIAHLYDVNDVRIHCKGCKEVLCMGSDLRKRGPNFITYSPEFEKKICIQNKQKPLTFRFDSHIAYTFCGNPKCNRQLGPKIKYNSGRPYGYALSKDGVMWSHGNSGEFRHIKQWSKVPFAIVEEVISGE